MGKKDNARIMANHVARLRRAADELSPASPAIADLLRTKADYLQSGIDGRGFDHWGMTVWEAKVDTLIEAAHTLLAEWRAHQGGPG